QLVKVCRLISFDCYSNFLLPQVLNPLRCYPSFQKKCKLGLSYSVCAFTIHRLAHFPVMVRTDPYLFQILYWRTASGYEEFWNCLLYQMCMSSASPRLIRARNYVRAVTWEDNVPEQRGIETPLDHFPNLVQLCLCRNIFPHQPGHDSPPSDRFEITQRYPYLQRVATCIFHERNTPRNAFGSPFWASVTHLQLLYYRPMSSPESPFQSPLLATMPSLTHLALSPKTGNSELDVNLALSRVRSSFPPSLVLCILALMAPLDVNEEYWTMETSNASLQVDQRIVMWSEYPQANASDMLVADSFEAWCAIPDRKQTFWDMGEAILKKRLVQAQAV
ncbi:hypothetical protein DL96DRAFT_1595824, partial [Flagelloscypha sp. PMI_526]